MWKLRLFVIRMKTRPILEQAVSRGAIADRKKP